MACIHPDKFVRLPTRLLESLLGSKLTGVQLRILLWVVRSTYGWNRASTSFTWYRIAKELCIDRATVYRAGKVLLQARVLDLQEERLVVQNDIEAWDPWILRPRTDAGGQL